MPSPTMLVIVGAFGLTLLALAALLVHAFYEYTPKIRRIFEEKPLFQPLRVPVTPGGEDVRFRTPDGLELAGTYYPARTPARSGVIVFCHEFLSDRRSFLPYVGDLRDLGYDLFTFDFRNHGESPTDPNYEKIQWVTDREVWDLQAALAYVRSRPDADPAGVGLFGISRGGNAALCVAALEPSVWGVITDGAFPTRGTMNVYMHRWARIYIHPDSIWMRVPQWVFSLLVSYVGWATRIVVERQRRCQFPDVEKAAARLAPRPLLMIHGEKDSLIGPEIARDLFALAGEPKDLWIVPEAKHNRCREVEPEAYRERIAGFVTRFGPRPPYVAPAVPAAAEAAVAVDNAVLVPAAERLVPTAEPVVR